MIKNNIISLVIHSIMIYILVILRWDKLSYSSPFFVVVLVCLLLCAIYILIGFLILKDTGSIRKNIYSTGSIIILGIVIWAICLGKTDYNHLYSAFGDDGFVSEWRIWHDSIWVYFDAFTLPSYAFTFPIEIVFSILYLNKIHMIIIDSIKIYYAFMPSLLFCAGIYVRSRRRIHHP